ncbi:MAG: hypothetical protein E6833_28285, partial [Bradyrhizobium sp.]|nr:hypothetical protein [Bradyrhizobium sp.]
MTSIKSLQDADRLGGRGYWRFSKRDTGREGRPMLCSQRGRRLALLLMSQRRRVAAVVWSR